MLRQITHFLAPGFPLLRTAQLCLWLIAIHFCMLAPTMADPMVDHLEAQIRAAEQAGVNSPELDQLREMLRVLRADAAATRAYELEQARMAEAFERERADRAAAMAEERARLRTTNEGADPVEAGGNHILHYTTRDGEPKTLKVDKSQRSAYAGLYANEYRDPALADFRYTLYADGSAVLEFRACENCTHELDGSPTPRGWRRQYQAVSWAPMVMDDGAPMERNLKDLYDKPHRARVLVVALAEGGVMSLNHYEDEERSALGGPYGVPRFFQE